MSKVYKWRWIGHVFFFGDVTGNTTITDFVPGTDKIRIDTNFLDGQGITFEQIGVTCTGTNASSGANIILDSNGDIDYDDNGTQAGGCDLVGSASADATLTSSNFEVG